MNVLVRHWLEQSAASALNLFMRYPWQEWLCAAAPAANIDIATFSVTLHTPFGVPPHTARKYHQVSILSTSCFRRQTMEFGSTFILSKAITSADYEEVEKTDYSAAIEVKMEKNVAARGDDICMVKIFDTFVASRLYIRGIY
jgi:hypothetical protein